jgi:hypothetical protein
MCRLLSTVGPSSGSHEYFNRRPAASDFRRHCLAVSVFFITEITLAVDPLGKILDSCLVERQFSDLLNLLAPEFYI